MVVHGTTQYDNIISLTGQLSNCKKSFTQRRTIAKELEQQLSNHDVRKRLAAEVSPRARVDGFSIAARRCQVLSMLWSNALSRCIIMTKEIVNESKVKCTIEDIRLPDKILRASSQPDDAFDSNGLGIPKLSTKSVRNALKFCLEILQNENIPEGGDPILMDMLAFLCSKNEYMGCFKYAVDFRNILSEISYRLSRQDDVASPMSFESASKAFGNFFCTCNRLGIEVHGFISHSLQIVSKWCKINIQRNIVNSSSCSRQHFFNAIANMLCSHPDHSIGPLKRYGRYILRYCKKAYIKAQGFDKEAFNRYILAHLFVAQIAGKIQGLIDGDLGDLGSASLTERQLLDLLDLGMIDVVKVFDKDVNAVTMSRKIRQKMSNRALWSPMDCRQQLSLELVTRLLACAQRLYISREGWDALENPDEKLGALLKVHKIGDESIDSELPENQKISFQILAKSPWMYLILRKIMPPKYGTVCSDPTAIDKIKHRFMMMQVKNPLNRVLELISNDNDAQESPIPYLAIIGASAEFFPAGECWAVSAVENWHCFIPEDKFRGDVIWCHGSSAFDLVSLLSVLSKLLEEYGPPESDSRTQYWILLILTKLTESTAVIVQNTKDKEKCHPNLLISLTIEWRMIWKTLLRHDLWYISCTNFLGENSLGEIFVILLTEIISRKCTELLDTTSSACEYRQSSFIYEQQNHVWTFLLRKPAIFRNVGSSAQFELISSISKFVGLSDSKFVEGSERPLRHELVRLSLYSFKEVLLKRAQSTLQRSSKHELIRSIASCIVCLVNGTFPSMPSLSSTASRFSISNCYDKSLSIEENSRLIPMMRQESNIGIYLELLWGNKDIFKEDPDLSCFKLHRAAFDSAHIVARRLRDQLKCEERSLEKYTSDFISESDTEKLRRKVLTFVDDEISYHSKEAELSMDSNEITLVRKQSQTGAVKLVLSILITQKSLDTDLLARIPDIISFFTVSISDLARAHFEPGEFLEIAYDLQQISQTFIEINSRHPSTLDLSQQIMTRITDCQSMLKIYACQFNNDDPCLTSNKSIMRTNGESEDDDLDFASTDMSLSTETSFDYQSVGSFGQNKRRVSGYDYQMDSSKRRKTKSIILAPPDFKCAKVIGSLLLALEPSVSNCRLVCESLLGTDIDVDPESIQGDMDLCSVIKSVYLLGTREVLLNDSAKQKMLHTGDSNELSPIVMLCQVIDLVRDCAGPSSRFFMYGNYDCAKVAIETLKLGLTLTCEEAKLVIGILSVEDGMRSRPSLRAQRVQATTYAFENGSNDFHHLFDKFFSNSIVKVGFDDPNFILRRLASIAAGVASRKLDGQRILNYVSNRIAPIFSATTANGTIDMFTDWYVRSGLSNTEEQDTSTIEAKDSLEVMESDSIFAKALLAGSTCNRKAFIKLLHEILEIPIVRPGLELMCYRALEKIASMRGYSDVQELVDLETEALLAVWLQKMKDANTGDYSGIFPQSLTSPKSIWYIMLYGRYDYLNHSQFSPEPNVKSMNFRKESGIHFVRRNQGFIIPFTLLKSHNIISEHKNSNSIIRHFSNDLGFKAVLAMTDFNENIDSDEIRKLFHCHVIDIQTMCILFINSDDILQKKVGQNILESLTQVVTEETIEPKINKNISLLIQRVIQLAGETRSLYEVMPISETAYYRAIKYLANASSESPNTSGDIFIHVGTSLTEVTIYAYDKLVRSKFPNHQQDAWFRFVLLGEIVSDQFENGGEQIQLDFFLHALNKIVLKNSLQKSIRSQALFLIKKVLRESLRLNKTEFAKEVTPVINKLIGVCFHVHEESQQILLQNWRQKLSKYKFDLRRSCGFQLHNEVRRDVRSNSSFSALDLKESIRTCTSAQLDHDCLVGTYDILLWIVENNKKLALDSCVFVNLSSSFEVESSDLDILGKVDIRYYAQALRQDFGGRKSNGTLHQCISELKYRTQKLRFLYKQKKPVDHNSSRFSCKHTTIDERLLCAELSHVEIMLGETKMKELSHFDFNCLLSYLCCICTTSCSQKARFASSRCIALLEPSSLMDASGLNITDVAPEKLNYDSLMPELRAKCIDCLVELLKSPTTEVSMAALMTLEAVLLNDAERSACSMITSTTSYLIKPFICKGQSGRVNSTTLINGERRLVMKGLGIKDLGGLNNTRMWCWDEKIWTFGNGTAPQFEVWIRQLTSAIIICCFDGKLTNDTENCFFWNCQKIAYLDHVFASTIFPSLILALLQRGKRDYCDEDNFNSLKALIATSFESLLLKWIRPDNLIGTGTKNDLKHKSISIVIDTLDVLRKVSQGRFLSTKHKPNKTIKKKSIKGGHNVGLDPLIPWHGVSYGVILNMDGIIVAEACMEVQRFASALFFLEMYFNSEYGKSGGLFEELDNTLSCVDVMGEFNGVRDIGGINYFSKIQDSCVDDLRARTLKAMSMTGRCYKELGENQLMHAANMQLSSLNFTDNSDNLTADLDKLRGISSLDTLQVLGFRSSQRSDPDNQLFLSLTDSMEALGLEGLINTYIEGVFVQNKELKEMPDIEILREKWFENNLETQNWTILFGELSKTRIRRSSMVTPSGKPPNRGYFELLSESLNSLLNSDTNNSKQLLDQAHSRVIDSLSDLAGEQLSPVRLIKIVDRLRALQDVNTLIEAEVDLSTFDFDEMWMLKVSSRVREITLTSIASKYPEKPEVLDILRYHLWKTCDSAVCRGRPQIAESALSKLRYLLSVPITIDNPRINESDEILRIRLEEAKIMECRGDFNGAIQRSKQLIRHIGDQNANESQKCLLCDAQILCGSWMTKYKTQQARVILESYLNPAATRAKCIFEHENTKANAERTTRVFIKLGNILANLHDDLISRIQSKEWEETESRLQQQHQQCLNSEEHRLGLKQAFEKLRESNPRKEEMFKHWRGTDNYFLRLEKEYKKTNKERNEIKSLVPHYLNSALKSFLSALEMAGTSSDDLSSHIFRMISLWFSYQNDTARDEIADNVIQEGLCKIPSFRFVTLTNQLFSRIECCEGRNDQKFQDTLHYLVFRMCTDHPYHCVAPLIALTNGKVDSKVRGVQQIIDKIDKSGTRYVKDLLQSYIILISAYNDLAHISTKKYQGSKQPKRDKIKFSEVFPSATKKSLDRCLSRLPGIPSIITCPPVVRPGKDYGGGKKDPIGGERIAGFESDFAITETGIHRPKIVMCTGSQGGSFRQLVKGEDDIRQDAIMSQVFTYVNNVMKRRTNNSLSAKDPSTLKTVAGHMRHRLKMITYNVLSLSPSSGVLEWVEGSLPIIDFLNDHPPSGRVGAHSRYYPGEWSNNRCRLHLENSPLEEKRKSFDETCARYSPSFRFFFFERFGTCMESWHIAKMNFTRSVAVNSIVGHVLGIGDRHLGNILIDRGSGEVVHIDFGFVFEQGKLLPIPECVPFRLTRNMVDGMGPCGTEGLFVSVAEETISTLRQHVQELLAILSAVVADPLYKWSVTPTKAQRRQSDEARETNLNLLDGRSDPSSDKNSQATAKIINKIKEKLQGYEDSTSGEQQGVEGQVQLLINSARDPNNLCKIFPGWGPWM